MRRHRLGLFAALPAVVILAFASGCQRDEVSHYKVPKEAGATAAAMPTGSAPSSPMGAPEGMPPSAAPPGLDGMGTADVAPPPKPTGKGSLKWTLPKGWIEGEAGGMRYATLKPPFSGKVEATVVVLPGTAGGELGNVNRWRGQIGLGPIDEKALASARKAVTSKAGTIAVFDFTSEGQVKSRMVAGLLSTPDGNTWFLKLSGDAEPVAKAQPDFMRFMGSLHLD